MPAEYPWLRQYDPGVPHTLAPYPETTLLDRLRDIAATRPHQVAVLFKGAPLTWGELDRRSTAFAAALRARGLARGERLALLLPNCPQFLIAEMGAWKAGLAVVPLNPLYTETELLSPLRDTGARAVVVLTPFHARVKALQARTGLRHVIATRVKEYLPLHLRVPFTLFREAREGHRITLPPGDHWMEDLVAAHGHAEAPPDPARPEETALILMSGGTTGRPKGVIAPHRSLVMTARQVQAWAGPLFGDPRDPILLPLPLFHAFGCVGVQGVMLQGGHPLALVPDPRDLDDLLDTLHAVRPATFFGVPALFAALLAHGRVKGRQVDFRSLRLCLSGASPLHAETRRRFEEATGGRLMEAYSLTEALLAVVGQPVGRPSPAGSVGLPLPDVEVRIVDGESGERSLPAGEVGEILLRAPQQMPGYWDAPGESADALRTHGEGGPWLHTGDLGRLDGEGFLYVVDRKKDVIKPGGLQVWPREVEEVLAQHPAVAEAGVAGVPDPVKGEAVKAWVVLRPSAHASEAQIRGWCKERLAPFKVPAQVEFRKELPKSTVGKVLRRQLREEHAART